jgi:hypothetical protein
MRTITTTTGVEIVLDDETPDLVALLETLYREVTVRLELSYTYEDLVREVQHLVDQMTDDERRAYLTEGLLLSALRYENDKLAAYARRLTGARKAE